MNHESEAPFYRQFTVVSNYERIFKISQHLMKLLQRFDTTFF